MSKRAVLWIAFAVVHVGVAALGWVLPNQPMGDVQLVYLTWSTDALTGRGVAGIDVAWVYPQLALVPLVLAKGLQWIAGYEIAWALLVTALDAAAFAILVGRGRSSGRFVTAWFWLVFIAMLGPVGMYRLEGVTTPIALAGCLWLVGRPWIASALLTVAMWIKVWPAALIVAAVVAVRRRLAVIGTTLALSGVVLLTIVVLGGGAHALAFVTEQTGRGLQVEAPVSAFYLWRAVAGHPDSFVYYDHEILTFQVTGPGVEAVIAVMTPVLVAALIAVVAVGAVKAWRAATFAGLFPPLALALVLAMIVFNKVGSPQYLSWLIAPLAIGLVLDRRRWWPPAALALVAALLTQVVYPLTYGGVTSPEPFPVAVLTARNVLLVVLFGWTMVMLARTRTHPHRARRAVAAAPAPEPIP
ncbi:hypothetical protein AB1K54_05435 [Microbacterium sp. BWT-B31]|uniref:hypothetical protein n=1 Tax=Microbacterium sp. BWT-B31 TaxID=3232072 RepID=UPI0035286140